MRAFAALLVALAACRISPSRVVESRPPAVEPAVDLGAIVRFDDADAYAADGRAKWPTWPSAPLVAVDRASIRARIPRLRVCYAAGLARDGRLAGRVDLLLDVDDSGAVASIATTTCHEEICSDVADDAPPPDAPFADAAVVECMKAALRGVRFEQVRGAVVLAPFELDPSP